MASFIAAGLAFPESGRRDGSSSCQVSSSFSTKTFPAILYRVIPTDGRKHRADANPSYYGDAVGRWDGDTLVVDSTNFVEDTWFGEDGYIHSDAMRVIERFWRVGENLAYQVTVEDPKVLTQPWTNFVHIIKPSNVTLEESPICKEDDAHRLVNLDHHLQR